MCRVEGLEILDALTPVQMRQVPTVQQRRVPVEIGIVVEILAD
jgi:hypothetical protein